MLLIAPPSETKRASPEVGPPVDLAELSFRELTAIRLKIIDALIETSESGDAFARLGLRPSFAADIARNARLLELPAMPAHELYTGPLHRGLDVAGLSDEGREAAARALVVCSEVWGLVRPDDAIPAYRCGLFSSLAGLDRLDHLWRTVLPDVLATAAGDEGVIVDLRSPTFQQIGMPAGLGDRTVILRVGQGVPGARIGDVVAKRVRGEAAHVLLETGADLDHPVELAEILGDTWPVQLDRADRPGRPWTLSLSVED